MIISFPKFFPLLVVLTLVWACKKESTGLTEIEKANLVTSIQKFNDAFAHSDIRTLENMITLDYRHTNGTSKVIDGGTWLNYLRKRDSAIEEGKLVVNKYAMTELDIQYQMNTAIVTGKVSISFEKEGEMHDNEFRVTNLWIFQDGTWKRAGFHDGKIK